MKTIGEVRREILEAGGSKNIRGVTASYRVGEDVDFRHKDGELFAWIHASSEDNDTKMSISSEILKHPEAFDVLCEIIGAEKQVEVEEGKEDKDKKIRDLSFELDQAKHEAHILRADGNKQEARASAFKEVIDGMITGRAVTLG